MADLLPLLAGSGFALVTGAAGLLGLALQRDAEQKRFAARVARVSAPQMSLRPEGRPALRDLAARHARLFRRLLAPLGVDAARLADYPIRWWLVLLIALAASRAAVSGASALLGVSLLPAWPAGFVLASRIAFGAFHARRSLKLFTQFPDALATIVRCVRVGIPVAESLRIIARDMPAPTAVEFGRMADRVSIGVPIEEALTELAARNALAEYRFFATALTLQARTGGALSHTLETLAEVIRKRVQTRARAHALASEAKASAVVLTLLPVLTAMVIWIMAPGYIGELFHTPAGRHLLALAIGMLALGIGIMRAIIRKSLD